MSTTCKIYIEHSIPVYRGGDTLTGHLEVNTTSDELFKVAVSFEGHTRTWLSYESFEEHAHIVPTADHRFLKEAQLFKSAPSYLQFSNGKLNYHFPFEFTIPNQLISSHSDIPSEFLDLPPTTKEGAILRKKGRTYMQPLISYIIKASIFPDSKDVPAICTEETEIVVEPTAQPSPPSESSSDNYAMSLTKPLKRHPWSRPIGELTLTTSSPHPLNTSTLTPKAHTTLPLTLSFHPYHGIIPPNQPGPPNWIISIQSSIRTDTFYSTHKFTSVPTIAEASMDLHTGFHSLSSMPETREFRDLEWRTWRDCLCLDSQPCSISIDQRNPCWTTLLDIPITAVKDMQPGFLSILSARRHTVVVKVGIKGYSHEEMEVEVPLRVVNCPGIGEIDGVCCGDEGRRREMGVEVIPTFEESLGLGGDRELSFTSTKFVVSGVL